PTDVGSTFFVGIDGQYAGRLTVLDPLRPSAAASVKALQDLGVEVVMATGDQQGVADAMAKRVGIRTVYAAQSPDDKRELVKDYRSRGGMVAMIGDGINDAPALAEADVGIALGSGADIALDAAAIVVPFGDLDKVADAIRISRKTLR